MLTIHRPGLGDLIPMTSRYHGTIDPGFYQPAPKPRSAIDMVIRSQAEGKPRPHPPGHRQDHGQQEPQGPGPDAATPTATVTSPTGVTDTEAMPAALPAEPEAVATPKRWPWVVGGIAAAGALILGTRLLRR